MYRDAVGRMFMGSDNDLERAARLWWCILRGPTRKAAFNILEGVPPEYHKKNIRDEHETTRGKSGGKGKQSTDKK